MKKYSFVSLKKYLAKSIGTPQILPAFLNNLPEDLA
jgi:hypothetical protein